MTKQDDLSILNEGNRDMIRSMVDNRIWIAIGKFSAALFAVLVVLCGLIFYTYNQGENFTDEKLNIVVENSNEQAKFNRKLELIMKTNQLEIAHLTIALAEEKKIRERENIDIRKLITTLGTN